MEAKTFDQWLARPGLIALLRMAGLVLARAPDHILHHHPSKWRANLEALGVLLIAFERRLLAVALKLQDLQVRGFGHAVRAVEPGEALDVGGRDIEFAFGFEAVDFTKKRTFAKLQPGLGEVGLGLL